MDKKLIKQIFKVIVVIFVLFWCSLFLCQKIDLTTADLGRHIKNGEMLTSSHWSVLTTNFYSYTQPDFKFVNHHWLSGVVFFGVEKICGWLGLHIFYVLIYLLTFLIFFRLAVKKSNFTLASILAFVLVPIIADRQEIRPEVFGYFFSGIFLLILCHSESRVLGMKNPADLSDQVNFKKNIRFQKIGLLILPLLTLVWVNLHISFIFGIFLIGIFWFNELIKMFRHTMHKFKSLTLILITSVLAALINPHTWRGLWEPLNIFKSYGYRIVENQSIYFLENFGLHDLNFLLIKICISLLVLSFVLVLIFNKKKFHLPFVLIGLTFGVLAYIIIRNFAQLGLFALPILALNTQILIDKFNNSFEKFYLISGGLILAVVAVGLSFIYQYDYLKLRKPAMGLGLLPRNGASMEFFKKNQLFGPIFNNYDIGGYLIFHLFPQEKVFVDNRPEAYSVSFLQDTYIQAQEDQAVWYNLNEQYNFNVVYFTMTDITTWGQNFLFRLIDDPGWAPIFADQYAIIFVKNNPANQDLIKSYRIPRENFSKKQ